MDSEVFQQSPYLAARLLALEMILMQVLTVLDDDAQRRLLRSFQSLHGDGAPDPENLSVRAQADVFRNVIAVLGGDATIGSRSEEPQKG